MFPLLAQADPSAQAAPGFFPPLPLLMLLMGLFFVVFVLPQNRRQRKEQEQMLAKMKPGAKVVLSSGIVGNVVTAKDGEDEITIRSADAKLRVLRSSVTRVVADDAAEAKV
jgi:preprotein translocase subunit YajC